VGETATGIVVFGSLNYDILFEVDHLPRPGETLPARSMSFQGGGKGANQAYQAALLGGAVAMVDAVGKDPLGDYLVGSLRNVGVATEGIRRVVEPTGVGSVSFIGDGSIAATIGRGANFAVTASDVDASRDLFSAASLVLLQLENPIDVVAHAAVLAREERCRVILNAAPAEPLPPELIESIDILVVNEVEAAYYLKGYSEVTGETAADAAVELVREFGASVVLTLGPFGSLVAQGEASPVFITARAVAAVETTGAGDSYIGAMAVALAEGRSLVDAARFGALAASITVGGVGAQGSMPDRAAVAALE